MPNAPIAIIDIGSNAIRFYLARSCADGSFEVLEHKRAPIRLGHSVFNKGYIDADTLTAATAAIANFHRRSKEHGARICRAVATSATREADNRETFQAEVKAQTGIEIEVISGELEAQLLAAAVGSQIDLGRGLSILVDLGGGSVEVARVDAGQLEAANSHPLGALRILSALGQDADHLALRNHVAGFREALRNSLGLRPIRRLIAVGGNINSLAELAGTPGVILTTKLQSLLRELAALTPDERAKRYALKPDRADTIVPAAVVYVELTALADAQEIIVPKLSIANALIAETLRSAP